MLLRGQSRGFWVEVLWSRLRALSGGGETVIEVGRAEDGTPRREKSPCNPGICSR
jgi:hypothetical protein